LAFQRIATKLVRRRNPPLELGPASKIRTQIPF
jgi:hypothetical protein